MTIEDFFRENRKAAIAFSGGVDSAYLLYEAMKNEADVTAYYVQSPFQPLFEREDAERLAGKLNAKMKVINKDVLEVPEIASNPKDRCYHCKRCIMEAIQEEAMKDGYMAILDGTNASDDTADRPGTKALGELGVLSPLRACGLTKAEIRKRSRAAGLFTWDKAAYACLATRIPTGEAITEEKLERTENAENFMYSLGFRDFRVRLFDDSARIQIRECDIPLLIENRERILKTLKESYKAVLFDLEVRDE